jgi:uncharacterized membrane protein YeaQ/YmgE (transglycosylase-associated protein family)
MLLILWIALGTVTGFIVTLLVTKNPAATLVDVLLGAVGAVVAGQISVVTNLVQPTDPGLGILLVAVAGALVTVVTYRSIARSRRAQASRHFDNQS